MIFVEEYDFLFFLSNLQELFLSYFLCVFFSSFSVLFLCFVFYFFLVFGKRFYITLLILDFLSRNAVSETSLHPLWLAFPMVVEVKCTLLYFLSFLFFLPSDIVINKVKTKWRLLILESLGASLVPKVIFVMFFNPTSDLRWSNCTVFLNTIWSYFLVLFSHVALALRHNHLTSQVSVWFTSSRLQAYIDLNWAYESFTQIFYS